MRGTTSGQAHGHSIWAELSMWFSVIAVQLHRRDHRSATRRVNLTFFLFGKFNLRPACETTMPLVILLRRTVNYEHMLSSRPTSRFTL